MVARHSWLIASCAAATWDDLRSELLVRQHDAGLSDEDLAQAAELSPEALARFLSPEPEFDPSLCEMVRGARALGCLFELTRPDLGNAPTHTIVSDDHPEWAVFEAERIVRFLKLSRIAYGISRDDVEQRIGALGVVAEMEDGEPDAEFRYVLAMIHALDVGLIIMNDSATRP